MKPNLFDFATSELSQDAFFCWLISWVNESHKKDNNELFLIGRTFLKMIGEKFPESGIGNKMISSLKVKKQYKNIDFLVILNDEIIILFEDKIRSKYHGDQLKKYSDIIMKEYPNHRILKIYLKSDYVWKGERKFVEGNDFQIIDIQDLKNSILKQNSGNNIFNDYHAFLSKRISSYESFQSTPCNHWKFEQWLGFYYLLSQSIDYVNFDKHYVGETCWFIIDWKANYRPNCNLSLEIFSGKLLIKGNVVAPEIDKKMFYNETTNILLDKFEEYDISKSGGKNGIFKTLVKFRNFPISQERNGLLDVENTVHFLQKIRTIFKSIN